MSAMWYKHLENVRPGLVEIKEVKKQKRLPRGLERPQVHSRCAPMWTVYGTTDLNMMHGDK